MVAAQKPKPIKTKSLATKKREDSLKSKANRKHHKQKPMNTSSVLTSGHNQSSSSGLDTQMLAKVSSPRSSY